MVKKRSIINKKYAIIIFLCAVLIGSVHGLYASYVRDLKHQHYVGSELCNGEILRGKILTTKSDHSILLFYQVLIKRGKINMKIYDPQGNKVSEFNDWEDVLRQKVLNIERHGYGTWTFSLECEKADFNYEIMFDVN